MAYDEAILQAFREHETALKFQEWIYRQGGPVEAQSAARHLATQVVLRARKDLDDLIVAAVVDEQMRIPRAVEVTK
jgi:hypothetical protein